MKRINNELRERAIALRKQGKSVGEIREILSITKRQAMYLVRGLKFSAEQQHQKSIERKAINLRKKYESAFLIVNKDEMRPSLKRYGFHGTRQRMHMGDGLLKFCIKKLDIPSSEIASYPRKSGVKKPTYCAYCGKVYPPTLKRRTKLCSSCYCLVHRLLSKIRSVRFLGEVCSVCGLRACDKNYAAFDFHHPNDNKDGSISWLLSGKWSALKDELSKCELVCANCHRNIHSHFADPKLLAMVYSLINKDTKCREGIDEHAGLTDGTGWGKLLEN